MKNAVFFVFLQSMPLREERGNGGGGADQNFPEDGFLQHFQLVH